MTRMNRKKVVSHGKGGKASSPAPKTQKAKVQRPGVSDSQEKFKKASKPLRVRLHAALAPASAVAEIWPTQQHVLSDAQRLIQVQRAYCKQTNPLHATEM